MRTRSYRHLAAPAFAAVLLVLSACGRGNRPPAGPPTVTTDAGEFTWQLWLVPDPPRQKDNHLWLRVRDRAGEAVDGAQVELGYLMPAMGAMPEMKGSGDSAARGDGWYEVTLDLPMGGTWKLPVTVRKGEVSAAAEYALTVGAQGLRQTSASGGGHAAGPMPHAHAVTPAAAASTAAIQLDAARRRQIGVRTAIVEPRPMTTTIRAPGKVVFDETRLADVAVKYSGWVKALYVDAPGQSVRRGQPLFALYSPELYASQQEYLAALASARAAQGTGAPDRADYLVSAARQRLRLWDLQPAQIERLERTGKVVEAVPILSTVSGVVVEKDVVEGAAVEPGMRLYRIAGMDAVWVEAEVYEAELPLVHVGDEARVSFPYLPGRSFTARIAFVYPYLDPTTRTGRVRIALPNAGLELKADMLAEVTLDKPLGSPLAVPQEAVLDTGARRFVFVDLGERGIAPRAITLGRRAGDFVEVLSGLTAGERIVTAGNFLVAAEARLKVPVEQWQ